MINDVSLPPTSRVAVTIKLFGECLVVLTSYIYQLNIQNHE